MQSSWCNNTLARFITVLFPVTVKSYIYFVIFLVLKIWVKKTQSIIINVLVLETNTPKVGTTVVLRIVYLHVT